MQTREKRRRRRHAADFKAAAVAACREPGASVAAVALDRKLNANLLRTWIKRADNGLLPIPKAIAAPQMTSFLPVRIDTHSEPASPDAYEGIARKAGLETARSEDVADTGAVMRVLEGRGNGLKLWMQSAPLSGHEDPNLCGVHSEPYPDPAQFVLSAEPGLFGTRSAAKQLGEQLFAEIKRAGFDVRYKSPVCGAAALRDPEVGAQLAPL